MLEENGPSNTRKEDRGNDINRDSKDKKTSDKSENRDVEMAANPSQTPIPVRAKAGAAAVVLRRAEMKERRRTQENERARLLIVVIQLVRKSEQARLRFLNHRSLYRSFQGWLSTYTATDQPRFEEEGALGKLAAMQERPSVAAVADVV
ncbi:hypothetical protein MRX96_045152 [Rhipicephalus microplus]